MKIALYQGKSLVSLAIRFLTRSRYSHAALLFDDQTEKAACSLQKVGARAWKLKYARSGSVIEAWQGGVRNSPSLSTLHKPGTVVDVFTLLAPLTLDQERKLLSALQGEVGEPYSFLGVLRFLSKRPYRVDGTWFCSELAFWSFQQAGITLLNGKQAWEVPPDWLQMPTLLRLSRSLTTS